MWHSPWQSGSAAAAREAAVAGLRGRRRQNGGAAVGKVLRCQTSARQQDTGGALACKLQAGRVRHAHRQWQVIGGNFRVWPSFVPLNKAVRRCLQSFVRRKQCEAVAKELRIATSLKPRYTDSEAVARAPAEDVREIAITDSFKRQIGLM